MLIRKMPSLRINFPEFDPVFYQHSDLEIPLNRCRHGPSDTLRELSYGTLKANSRGEMGAAQF